MVRTPVWSLLPFMDRHNRTAVVEPAMDPHIEPRAAVEIGDVLAPVQPGLRRVEAKMKALDTSLFTPLATAFVDLIGSGGKRLRPALALLAAHGDPNLHESSPIYARVISLAAAVEMLHTATLIHDDVIDGALLRRGAPTLNATWNRGATVLAGNYMFARAASFAAETQNPRVIGIFSNTLAAIVDGELRQLRARYNLNQDKHEYYQRIFAKTASLFCAATEAAAVLAELPAAHVTPLRDYGHNLGMAFQIVDDILDFTGDAGTLGKPAGSDLRQGTLTLPFFYYVNTHPHSDQLLAWLEESATFADDSDHTDWDAAVDQVVADLRNSAAGDAARQEAQLFIDRARAALSAVQDSPYRRAMFELCDFVIRRTY
jgi:geranylgeranyl pyrophosphate synthase